MIANEQNELTFNGLISSIQRIDQQLKHHVGRAVNIGLTLRNWFIGMYIDEFELHGTDRAAYGEKLFESASKRLSSSSMDRVDPRELRRYRQFFSVYPQIGETVSPQLEGALSSGDDGFMSVLRNSTPEHTNQKWETVSPKLMHPGHKLIKSLSFSHFSELLKLEDDIKRVFYEHECIRGNWSVRALRRQIGSLYFERSALSKDKTKLAELVKKNAEIAEPNLNIRDPYVFEFLGLKSKEVMSESALEDSLLDKLQEFLLELGYDHK